MQSNSEKKQRITKKHREEAIEIIDDLTSDHHVKNYRQLLQKLLLGWMTTPLEIAPEERLDVAIYYEDLQKSLTKIEQLQCKIDVEYVKSMS